VTHRSVISWLLFSLAMLLPAQSNATDTALIELLDVGQGDAILVTTQKKKRCLSMLGRLARSSRSYSDVGCPQST
jgi:beta-lactamase superfamily II metal-dependent hydrolase